MAKKCPDCGNSRLIKSDSLLICPECGYKEMSQDIDKNWLSDLSKDTKLWDKSIIDSLPFPLAMQYEEIHTAAVQNSAYKFLHALREFIHLLVRFSVLCAAAIMENQGIDDLLTERELSLEAWIKIAEIELHAPEVKNSNPLPEPLSELLSRILRLLHEQGLDKSEPDYYDIPALFFVETKEIIAYASENIQAIARMLREEHYNLTRIKFEIYKQQCVGGKLQENIILTIDDFKGTVHPYILLRQNELFFFEGMNSDRKRAIYRNFVTGILHERREAHFVEAAGRARDTFVLPMPEQNVSESEITSFLIKQSSIYDYVPCNEFEEWLRASLKDKGVLLFQSPSLSGKSVLCDALAEDAPEGKSINTGVKTIVYRCNPRTTQNLGAFISGLYYIMTGKTVPEYEDNEISSVLTSQPSLSLDGPESIATILNEYKSTCKEKLLVVIDGLDRIPSNASIIFDQLPGREELDEGVFLLLTCREQCSQDDNEAFLRFLERPFDSKYIIMRNSSVYEAMVRRYIEARVKVRTGHKWRKLTDDETAQLMRISDCRISNIKLYSVLLFDGTAVEDLPMLPKLFDSYMDAMRNRLGQKHFRPAIRILSAIASEIEPMTPGEICGLFDYNGITRQIMTQFGEITPFLRVVRDGDKVRLSLADPSLANKILGIFPEMIGDIVAHAAIHVLEASEDELNNPSSITLYCFAGITDYIKLYGNQEMMDVLCKYKIYYELISMSRLLFSGTTTDLCRREALLTSALVLLTYSKRQDSLCATVYNTRGNFYVSLCRYRDARDDYTASIQLGEKCIREFQMTNENVLAGTYINRGCVHRLLSQHNDAIDDFSRAIEMRERLFRSRQLTDEKEIAVVYHYRSQALAERGLYSQAVESYSHALEIWERLFNNGFYTNLFNMASSYYAYAMLLNLDGHTSDALENCYIAIKLLENQKRLDPQESDLLKIIKLKYNELMKTVDSDRMEARDNYIESELPEVNE